MNDFIITYYSFITKGLILFQPLRDLFYIKNIKTLPLNIGFCFLGMLF